MVRILSCIDSHFVLNLVCSSALSQNRLFRRMRRQTVESFPCEVATVCEKDCFKCINVRQIRQRLSICSEGDGLVFSGKRHRRRLF